MPLAATCGLGTNALKADGPRKYSDSRVLLANWVDDRKKPEFEGSRAECRTTYQQQQMDATNKHLPYYGATLPSQNPVKCQFEENIDYGNLVYYRKDFSEKSWISVTKTTINHHDMGGKDAVDHMSATANLARTVRPADPAGLDEYRQRWLNDADPAVRTKRFSSVNGTAMAASALKRFTSGQATERFLPGTVKSLDVLRDRLVDKHGLEAVLVLAQSFVAAGDVAAKEGLLSRGGAAAGGGATMTLSSARMHLAVADPRGFSKLALRSHLETVLGVHLTIDQETELYERFLDTTGSGKASADTLIRGMLGHGLNETRKAAVRRAWEQMQALVAMGSQKEAARSRSPGRATSPKHSPTNGTRCTLFSARTVFDPSYHPDVRRKPLPMRSAASAVARLTAGLASVLRMQDALGSPERDDDLITACNLVLGSCEVPAGSDPVAEHSETLFKGLDSVPLSYEAWETYCAFLGAAVDTDDDFARILDGCWHVALKPHLTACEPTYRESQPKRATGGYKTAQGDLGAGLQFASKPYVEGRPMPSPPPVRMDLDAVVTRMGADTHVTVLVTHTGGKKTLQKLLRDRFMDTTDVAGLLARLDAQLGIRDAVDASVDF